MVDLIDDDSHANGTPDGGIQMSGALQQNTPNSSNRSRESNKLDTPNRRGTSPDPHEGNRIPVKVPTNPQRGFHVASVESADDEDRAPNFQSSQNDIPLEEQSADREDARTASGLDPGHVPGAWSHVEGLQAVDTATGQADEPRRSEQRNEYQYAERQRLEWDLIVDHVTRLYELVGIGQIKANTLGTRTASARGHAGIPDVERNSGRANGQEDAVDDQDIDQANDNRDALERIRDHVQHIRRQVVGANICLDSLFARLRIGEVDIATETQDAASSDVQPAVTHGFATADQDAKLIEFLFRSRKADRIEINDLREELANLHTRLQEALAQNAERPKAANYTFPNVIDPVQVHAWETELTTLRAEIAELLAERTRATADITRMEADVTRRARDADGLLAERDQARSEAAQEAQNTREANAQLQAYQQELDRMIMEGRQREEVNSEMTRQRDEAYAFARQVHTAFEGLVAGQWVPAPANNVAVLPRPIQKIISIDELTSDSETNSPDSQPGVGPAPPRVGGDTATESRDGSDEADFYDL